MESAWLAAAAAGRPFAVLRVVVDTPSRSLWRPLATLVGGLKAMRVLRRAAPALCRWAGGAGDREVLLANPRSFCAGAQRAIEIVERALERYGAPVYVRKQIVHNVARLRRPGARGADLRRSISRTSPRANCASSRPTAFAAVRAEADERGLRVIDATCPLVRKVHNEARRFADAGYSIVLIGHDGHDEVEGTIGEAPQAIHVIQDVEQIDDLTFGEADRVAYLTQTTLAVDEVDEVVVGPSRALPRPRRARAQTTSATRPPIASRR